MENAYEVGQSEIMLTQILFSYSVSLKELTEKSDGGASSHPTSSNYCERELRSQVYTLTFVLFATHELNHLLHCVCACACAHQELSSLGPVRSSLEYSLE